MANQLDPQDTTILVVDDNESNRLLAQGTLEDEGYRVVLAEGGAGAIRAFERERPACVLLDVRMPEVDGFEACERIRALPFGADTPIIFLTALRDVETFDRALRSGGDDFLTKPFRPTELIVRVQAALKLRSARVELSEHYRLLKRQRDDLMRVSLQKERLMAFVVHDLKNPVNSMDLHAQVLLRNRDLAGDARAAVGQIRASARQLTRMIMNLLDLSKADEGKLLPKKTEVELTALAEDVFAELDVDARAHNVKLESSLAAKTVTADPDLLRRLLANLVENAIRHSPANAVVRLETSGDDAFIEIDVADAGTGIPSEMCEKIFDPFVQGESSGSVSRGGRGLGLTFCKMAAEAHGGTISVRDASPGAMFCVRLPAHG